MFSDPIVACKKSFAERLFRTKTLHASTKLVLKNDFGRKFWKYGKLPLNIILVFCIFKFLDLPLLK